MQRRREALENGLVEPEDPAAAPSRDAPPAAAMAQLGFGDTLQAGNGGSGAQAQSRGAEGRAALAADVTREMEYWALQLEGLQRGQVERNLHPDRSLTRAV